MGGPGVENGLSTDHIDNSEGHLERLILAFRVYGGCLFPPSVWVQALCCRLLEQAMHASFVSIDGLKSSMSFLLTLSET